MLTTTVTIIVTLICTLCRSLKLQCMWWSSVFSLVVGRKLLPTMEFESWLLTDCQVGLGKLLLIFTSVVILGSESCGTQPYCTVSQLWEFGLHLVLASTVILDSESRGTRDHILVSHNSRSPATHKLTVRIKSHYNWWTVSQSSCQAHLGPKTIFLLLSNSCSFIIVGLRL
jgi:hypothetical protein